MRYSRLRIANYRGVTAAEVEFRSPGITLVQGPNEVGKTSLGEAIGILFDYADSSKHRIVEAIRPVHRDEGPEIELEAESGPYAFTYFKRFYKKPETKLTITQPKPENLTGREAHERAQAILGDTLDIDLWKALAIQQGDAVQQPNLARQTSLSRALDEAAGGRAADAREEDIFSSVGNEYVRYFTERGAEKKDLPDARRRQADAQVEITGIERQLNTLEQDIERSATLQRELGQMKAQEDEQRKAVDGYAALLLEIGTLESTLSEARLKLALAQKSEQMARRAKEERQKLISEVDGDSTAYDRLKQSSEMSVPALNQAQDEFRRAQAILDKAETKRKDADTLATLRRGDFDYYDNKLHLELLKERKERIDEARKNATEAQKVLARNKVDSGALKKIDEAERALLTTNAQLERGAPSLLLRGLAQCKLQIDDVDTVIGTNEVRTLHVADKTRLTIPEMLAIEITAGSSTEELNKSVLKAQRALEAACKAAGVANPDDAKRAFEERREAVQHIGNKEQVDRENLRDLTYDQLVDKVISLEQSVHDCLSTRAQEPAICSDLESAKRERANAEAAQKQANHEWDAARKSLDATRKVRDQLGQKNQEARVQTEMLGKDIKRKRDNLERARATFSDDILEANLTEALRTVSKEDAIVRAAEASLNAKSPERIRALAETATGSLQTTVQRLNKAQTELTEVQTRLRIHGEEGLHEKLRVVQSSLERMELENLGLFQRAAVAKLLFETMREERDQARRAYVAPLKEKIERLGRLLFDDAFQVEISDELQMTSRMSKGVTVPFDYLSGGTKEQLSLIFRLACSMIVAKDGGTPLILDDALGYTDPERLQLMGAVLNRAAKECQIIIFTCAPDRYANVGDAIVVSLA